MRKVKVGDWARCGSDTCGCGRKWYRIRVGDLEEVNACGYETKSMADLNKYL